MSTKESFKKGDVVELIDDYTVTLKKGMRGELREDAEDVKVTYMLRSRTRRVK